MATHDSSYKLLNKFHLLGEAEDILAREDQLAVLRKQLKANVSKAFEINERQYNLRSREVWGRKSSEEISRKAILLSKLMLS